MEENISHSLNDFQSKLKVLRGIIKEQIVNALLITSQKNFSWLTPSRSFIGIASESACANLLITIDKVYLISDNVEVNRLMTEELAGYKNYIFPATFNWYETSKKQELIDNLTDSCFITDLQIEKELFNLRTILSDQEAGNFRETSLTVARCVEKTVKILRKGISEFETAGILGQELWSNGIEPITLLVAFDERTKLYRHPLPSRNTFTKIGILSVCGRKNGLITSVSRMVSIGKPDETTLAKYIACVNINAAMIATTFEGESSRQIFKTAVRGYAAWGFDGEWKNHHQGGLTGYVPREYKIADEIDYTVKSNQAFAFNPTVQGVKCEDTILVKGDKNEIVTYTGDFDYIEVKADGRELSIPDIYRL